MPAFPDLTGPLRSSVAELRFAAERDIPEILIAHQDDPELYLRLGLKRPPSAADLGRRSEGEARARETGEGVRFTILEPGSDVCVGQADVHRTDWEEGRAEAGLWVAPALRGRGIAPAALRLAAGYLFGACGLARLQLLTEPDNSALLAAAQRAGFAEEGRLRAYLREHGRRVDVIMLSLLAEDLAVVR